MSRELELQDAIISLRQAITNIIDFAEVVEAWAEMVERRYCPTQRIVVHPLWGDKVATEKF